MKKCFCVLLFFLVGFIQVDGGERDLSELDSAFILAVKQHRLEDMQELIQAGADINTPIPYTMSDCDCDWDMESTALIYAVLHNRPDMVKILVEVENDLNKALYLAISKGYPRVVDELIIGGVNVNCVYDNEDTPLILAVKCQMRRITQTLLDVGANVSHVNKYGRTALMEAVINQDLNTVQILLQVPEMNRGSFFGFGTKPINFADKDGNTALILAIQKVRYWYSNDREYQTCVNSQNIIKALFETPGIDPYHVNKNGDTAVTLLEKLNEKMKSYPY